jgi:hypothetical protein
MLTIGGVEVLRISGGSGREYLRSKPQAISSGKQMAIDLAAVAAKSEN